jgi:FKBP-type peptidyl-prolyl cis-trans isomerase 2
VKIEKGLRVRVKVELSVKDGDPIEKSVVEYIQGGGTMLPGLEKVLEGLEKGAKRDGLLAAKEAFGSPQSQPTKVISRDEFPKEATLAVGERFEAKGPDGQPVILEVIDNKTDTVEVRFVHQLADKDITYDVEVLSVTDPTPPPLPAEAVAADADDE